MKVTRGEIIRRGLGCRCPNCGGRTLFQPGRPFHLNRQCPRCGLVLERDEGFYLGSLSLNYGVTICGFLLPVLILALTGVLPVPWAVGIAMVGAFVVPVLLYRPSRSWFLMNYYVFLPQHLPANQQMTEQDGDKNT